VTGRPFLPALLGASAALAFEMAFGADLTDTSGASWTWTDVTADLQHNPGVPITVGRTDNVGQAGAAHISAKLGNAAGNYTAGNPLAAFTMRQNTPVRERMTLDGVNWSTRFQGYLDSANPITDQSAKVRWVNVSALGALGRIGGQKKQLRSPLYRAIISSKPTAYWPLEDPAGSATAASAVPGVGPLVKQDNIPAFGGVGPGGSASAADLGSSVAGPGLMILALPPSSATSWRYEMSMLCPDTDAYFLPISIYTAGQIWNISIQISSTNINVHTSFTDGSVRNDVCSGDLNDGLWHRLRFEVSKSGADTTYSFTNDGVSILSITMAGVAFGQPYNLQFGASPAPLSPGSRIAACHVALWQPFAPPVAVNTLTAHTGYAGETAHARLARLCSELVISLALVGTSDATMGPQSVDVPLNLLRECEAADHGMLFDGLGPGIGYQCPSARYPHAAAPTLDMGAPREVATLGPVFDRQAVKNLYAVSRKGGGTATFEQVTGPMGTAALGVEDAQATVNLTADDTLFDHAAWLTSLGTVPGFRYPTVALDMLNSPAKAAGVLGLDIGERITIVNPASKSVDLPPDQIDLIVEGWGETTTADTWSLTLNTSPYAPNDIATVGATAARVDSADSKLSAAFSLSATPITVTGTLPWSTVAGDLPFDIAVGGERMTVTNVAGGTLTVTRSVNGVVKAQTINTPVRVWTDLVVGL